MPIRGVDRKLSALGQLIAHRGPDGAGTWVSDKKNLGFAHRRLAVIDLSQAANQPMVGPNGTVIIFNGEIYNYPELRRELSGDWQFRTHSDTETILAAYAKYGTDCVHHLRGMFAFAIWDNGKLFLVRDRFGIKPLYFTQQNDQLIFASEAKALLPFLPEIVTDEAALSEYLIFQYPIGNRTLFKGIEQLMPAHAMIVENGNVRRWRYWDVDYNKVDFDHSPQYFERRLQELVADSIDLHLRSDVQIGSYVSGGIDSSLVGLLAAERASSPVPGFHGKFTCFPGYDESRYAEEVARSSRIELNQVDITSADFLENIEKTIYHLDVPIAGPGSFPQYMVSKLASEHVKVVLGGQGGDEIFGGYARYVIAYFEQCIRAAIDGTYKNGHFVVTIESIIPNLGALKEYKPLISQFWSKGLFGDLDQRYFQLIDRSVDIRDEVDWDGFNKERVFEDFRKIFNSSTNVGHESYFDKMTHFDFKCLLPALLHVEDRMSMAHGLEARVPMLDHPLVEFAATAPADVKFYAGHTKHLLRTAFNNVLPEQILSRRDKMGFPVPLKEWLQGDLRDFVNDIFRSQRAQERPYVNADAILKNLDDMGRFSRKIWALLNLELWQKTFHDRASEFRSMIKEE